MKRLLLIFALISLTNFINAQSFIPIATPHFLFITAECTGDNGHYNYSKKVPLKILFIFTVLMAICFILLILFKIAPYGKVYCMGYANNEIYIGGAFDTINGSILTNGLLKYNLTTKIITTTTALFQGKIIVTYIKAIKQWNSRILMAGSFDAMESHGFKNTPLIIGNNLSWTAFDSATYSNGNSCIYSNVFYNILINDSNSFYVAGSVLHIDTLFINSVAYWNNGHWTALGSGLPNNDLFGHYGGIVKQFGKLFVIHSDTTFTYYATSYFDGSNWAILGDCGIESVTKLLSHPCGLYVAYNNINTHNGLALYDAQLGYTNLTGVDNNSAINNIFDQNDSAYILGNIYICSLFKPLKDSLCSGEFRGN